MEMRASKGIRKKHMHCSAWKWIGLAFLGLAAVACADEGVGDPCTPETIPRKTGPAGEPIFGFEKSESYIESSSVQCRSRLCIVYQLDNRTNGADPADPRRICTAPNTPPGCVPPEERSRSVYCTGKCGGPKTAEQCECPDGFECKEIRTLGGDGIRGSYCVKPKPVPATP